MFRYAITGDQWIYPGLPTPDPADADKTICGSGGNAEIGGNDILNLRGDGLVMMHELGHSLTLRHGGPDNTHCKPNYVSVMNYVYDGTVGLPMTSERLLARYDFSPPRLANGTRLPVPASLDENSLNENNPIVPGDLEHVAIYSQSTGGEVPFAAGGAVDFNGDGVVSGSVSADINAASATNRNCDGTDDDDPNSDGLSILESHNDWGNLRLNFNLEGDSADAALLISDQDGGFVDDLDLFSLPQFHIDVAVDAELLSSSNGVADVRTTVIGESTRSVSGVVVTLDMSNGVSVSPIPGFCVQLGASSVECYLDYLQQPDFAQSDTEPAVDTFVFSYPPDGGSVTFTVTSEYNLVDTDPDPSDNVVEIVFDSAPRPPDLADDEQSAMIGETVELDVLENDLDPDDDLAPEYADDYLWSEPWQCVSCERCRRSAH